VSTRTVPPLRVLVPMKPLPQAKSRLWGNVPAPERRAAILLMLDRVVRASVDALGTEACHVVGGDSSVRRVAEAANGAWVEERGDSLNSSLWLAMREAYADGCAATLFLPGDLPCVRAADVLSVADASDGFRRPAGVRAEPDGGTNALLVPSLHAFEPLLGVDSFARHRDAADGEGTPLVEVDAPGLAFDMDSYDDFVWARENVAGFADGLSAWQAWLHEEESR
jgi:2-phospho-L-lactate guanylyltransferase